MRNLLPMACLAVPAMLIASRAGAQSAMQDVQITATIASYCTINAVTNPGALTATILVPNGAVDTSIISHTVGNVACNTAADVTATSLSGGVTTGGAAASGTTNIIDYTGVAAFGGATSTINTASNAAATGAEAGNTAATAGAATGNLVVSVTPVQPALPLAPSTAYADTLRVTLTAH